MILKETSNAEEQYALVVFYWRCRGVKIATSHRYKPLTQQEMEEIRRLRSEGCSIYKIAKQLKRHVSTIYYALKRF